MKKTIFVSLMILALAGFAAAQTYGSGGVTSDTLGAHLNYGRGCAACHAPHSGAYGNGAAKTADANSGNDILWGQDVGSLYNKVITSGNTTGPQGGNYVEQLPSSIMNTTPDVTGVLVCLSCHDGDYAQGAMMRNRVYENLPAGYGGYNNIPTLLGNDGTTVGNYLNDHPVGLNAAVTCGGAWSWDCTENNGVISMNGKASSQFVQNYGWFVSLANYNNTSAVVMCTSCHNQHLMNVVSVTNGKNTGLPTGFYQTMFFIRGPYNPASGTAGSNQTAQFCRSCHGLNSNEMNGGMNIGTTF